MRKAEREAGKFERSIASLGARRDLAALVRGMRTFGGHSGVREKGCRSLLNSTPSATGDEFRAIWEEDGERRKVMVQQYKELEAVGVIDVVCHAISINASVAATGCQILTFLARDDDNKGKIAQDGGIAAVLAALRKHPDSAGVQEWGCGALGWLVENADGQQNADNQGKITQEGGIAAVLAALRKHTDNAFSVGCSTWLEMPAPYCRLWK